MKRSIHLLLAALILASAVAHAQLTTDTVVLTTSDSKSLGYVNNPKFTVDSNSVGRFSVRTHDTDSNYNNALIQTSSPWSSATVSFQTPVFLDASGSIDPDAAPQRVASIALSSTSHTFMIWYGSDYADSSLNYSHQIHYADYDTTSNSAPTISSEKVPISISGFTSFYGTTTPYNDDTDYWQEHPSTAIDSAGTLYVVWEGRDAGHTSGGTDPTLKPGIAFMTRSSSGTWSSALGIGTLTAPPYMDIAGISDSQSRPLILAPSTTLQHVLCYGSVSGVQQILSLDINSGSSGTFSTLRPNSNDQRHISATLDPSGNTHAVWREGPTGGPVAVFYSERLGSGSWSTPVQVSATGSWASTPVVSADSSKVRIAFIQWTGGFKNSAGETNNGITATSNGDDDTVEGDLMFTSKPNGSGSFSTPVQLGTGYASYPNFAVGATNALIFQEWTTCGSNTFCSPQVHLGETN